MDSKLSVFDLVPFGEAATALQITENRLLKAASENEFGLFYPVQQHQSFVLKLAEHANYYDETGKAFVPGGDWFPLFDYNRDQNPVLNEIKVTQGQVLRLDADCITSIIVNGSFSKADLVNAQLDKDSKILDGMNTNYAGGSLMWTIDPELDESFSIDDIFLLESDIKARALKPKQDLPITTSKPSNTALKTIGLLMCHLAKAPKYASGSTPNKSEIKKLLLNLADEFEVNDYGLNKVDERLLTEAMKYLETQKN